MRIELIAFTRAGALLAQRLARGLCARGDECACVAPPRYAADAGAVPLAVSLGEWAGQAFARADGLVFVSACGIAVRAVAPFLEDKTRDPAVVVIDERCRFAISLLSGHVGGANALAVAVAGLTGAQPVVTTATDVNGLFAVDEWAARENLWLADRTAAKRVSAALLAGDPVGFCSDFPVEGVLPEGFIGSDTGPLGVCVSLDERRHPFDCTLLLVPRVVTAGVGCRRGIAREAVEAHVKAVFKRALISEHALCQVCSIDLKAEEPGLLAYCEGRGLPLQTYSSGELAALEGTFTASEFVAGVTGVDNVCERAAVFGAGRGKLLVNKQGAGGVTAALAARDWSVRFE